MSTNFFRLLLEIFKQQKAGDLIGCKTYLIMEMMFNIQKFLFEVLVVSQEVINNLSKTNVLFPCLVTVYPSL